MSWHKEIVGGGEKKIYKDEQTVVSSLIASTTSLILLLFNIREKGAHKANHNSQVIKKADLGI